jgi:alcohol dehydrogenase
MRSAKLKQKSSALVPGLLAAFDYLPRTRIIFGAGCSEKVGECAAEIGARKVLLVTDPGLVAAGHSERIRKFLLQHVSSVTTYDQVHENPGTLDVMRCVDVAKAAGIDCLVGLGGGSAMDTAKGCNFILTNGGRMQDYWGVGKATRPMLPLIAIPTTAGTGSECQSAALITDEATHQKMACLDPKAAARIAILDPALTLSQPRRVTACTGIDAITHAVEAAVTTRRTPLSDVFAREACGLLISHFSKVLKDPRDLEARAAMQVGAALAGLAIENSMLGAAHAAANPLTAHFGIVHGQAVGMLLPHVIRFNAEEEGARRVYCELAGIVNIQESSSSRTVAAFIGRIEKLLAQAGFPRSLTACGVKRSKIRVLAQEAAKQWTANFNPRPVGLPDFIRIYGLAI